MLAFALFEANLCLVAEWFNLNLTAHYNILFKTKLWKPIYNWLGIMQFAIQENIVLTRWWISATCPILPTFFVLPIFNSINIFSWWNWWRFDAFRSCSRENQTCPCPPPRPHTPATPQTPPSPPLNVTPKSSSVQKKMRFVHFIFHRHKVQGRYSYSCRNWILNTPCFQFYCRSSFSFNPFHILIHSIFNT